MKIKSCATRTLSGAVAAGLLAGATVMMASPSQAAPYTGSIEVEDAATSTVIGFVSDQFNTLGEYTLTTNSADALNVSFNSTSSPFSVTENNNPASSAHPYFGGITGFANAGNQQNLGAGSYNYAYLGGTNLSGSGTLPIVGPNTFTDITGISESIESSIWSVPTNGNLVPDWINSDGSVQTVHLEYLQGTLVFTGDPTVFANHFGTTELVKFVVPGATPPTSNVPEPPTFLLFGAGIAGAAAMSRRRRKTA